MIRKLLPALLLLTGFAFFIYRDRQAPRAEQTAEDVLIAMVQAMGKGEAPALLECFGGDLSRRLEAVVEQRGEREFARLLKERSQPVKGFAILSKESQSDDTVLVFTETVYADKNTRQTFLLTPSDGSWKIIRSDSEIVSTLETDFGKSIREVQ